MIIHIYCNDAHDEPLRETAVYRRQDNELPGTKGFLLGQSSPRDLLQPMVFPVSTPISLHVTMVAHSNQLSYSFPVKPKFYTVFHKFTFIAKFNVFNETTCHINAILISHLPLSSPHELHGNIVADLLV